MTAVLVTSPHHRRYGFLTEKGLGVKFTGPFMLGVDGSAADIVRLEIDIVVIDYFTFRGREAVDLMNELRALSFDRIGLLSGWPGRAPEDLGALGCLCQLIHPVTKERVDEFVDCLGLNTPLRGVPSIEVQLAFFTDLVKRARELAARFSRWDEIDSADESAAIGFQSETYDGLCWIDNHAVAVVLVLRFALSWPGVLSEKMLAEVSDVYLNERIRALPVMLESLTPQSASEESLSEIRSCNTLLKDWADRSIHDFHLAQDAVKA